MLKALGMVCSARRDGNCYDMVSYCLQQLKEKGIETSIIDFSNRNRAQTNCSDGRRNAAVDDGIPP